MLINRVNLALSAITTRSRFGQAVSGGDGLPLAHEALLGGVGGGVGLLRGGEFGVVCAVAGTIGADLAVASLVADWHGWAAVGLVVAALSPTGFSFVLAVLIAIAVVEAVIALRHRRARAAAR